MEKSTQFLSKMNTSFASIADSERAEAKRTSPATAGSRTAACWAGLLRNPYRVVAGRCKVLVARVGRLLLSCTEADFANIETV